MGSLKIAFLLIGIVTYNKSYIECHEASPENPIIHEYLANTLQSITTSPNGLRSPEQIKVVRILNAEFQVVNGIKFIYEFEGRGLNSRDLYVCELVLIRRAWLNKRNIEKYECQWRNKSKI